MYSVGIRGQKSSQSDQPPSESSIVEKLLFSRNTQPAHRAQFVLVQMGRVSKGEASHCRASGVFWWKYLRAAKGDSFLTGVPLKELRVARSSRWFDVHLTSLCPLISHLWSAIIRRIDSYRRRGNWKLTAHPTLSQTLTPLICSSKGLFLFPKNHVLTLPYEAYIPALLSLLR